MRPPFNSLSARAIAKPLRLIALAGLALAAPACAKAPATDPVQGRIEAAAAELESKGFEGVIAVAIGDEEPVIFGMGANAAASGVPDGNTQVDTGSITKTITAAAVMKLVDEGKITTTDTIGDYFDNAPAVKAPITLHQLLTHSAGLIDAVGSDLEMLGCDEFLERAFAATLLFEPGDDYSYSNVGYSVLAAIIEDVSGKSYEAFLKEDLLAETGLKTFGYRSVFNAERSLLAENGSDVDAASWGGQAPSWALIGNGGLITTAKETIEWRRKFRSGDIVSTAAVDAMQTPHVREGEGAPSFYAYGMVVEDHPNFGRTYWHNGGNPHFLANWSDFEDLGVIVFAASRSKTVNADEAVERIAVAAIK